MVQDEQEPDDSRELEGDAPVGVLILSMFDLVVEKHEAGGNQVGQNGGANVAQRILVQGPPRSVGSSKKDGL